MSRNTALTCALSTPGRARRELIAAMLCGLLLCCGEETPSTATQPQPSATGELARQPGTHPAAEGSGRAEEGSGGSVAGPDTSERTGAASEEAPDRQTDGSTVDRPGRRAPPDRPARRTPPPGYSFGYSFRSPHPVANLTDIVDLSVGPWHLCAVRGDGRVLCQGDNAAGELGVSSEVEASTTARPVEGVVTVAAVAVGDHHSCARQADGTVQCWGANGWGQLGDGSRLGGAEPRAVDGLEGVIDIALGRHHSCAVIASRHGRGESGHVACWGANYDGQLGRTEPLFSTAPVEVPGVDEVSELILSADTSCARHTDGRLSCWGDRPMRFFGERLSVDRPAPFQPVEWVTRQLALGQGWACALDETGNLTCSGWRSGRDAGAALGPLVQVAMGDEHACALLGDGTVRCWGDNTVSQLGVGSGGFRGIDEGGVTPEIDSVAQLALGRSRSCALREDGSVWCWGAGLDPVGTAARRESRRPPRRAPPATVRDETTADTEGTGSDTTSQDTSPRAPRRRTSRAPREGTGEDTSPRAPRRRTSTASREGTGGDSPRSRRPGRQRRRESPPPRAERAAGERLRVALEEPATAIAAGLAHACALLSSGRVACWGRGTRGELGIGERVEQAAPSTVLSLDGARQLALGHFHSCVLDDGGGVRCWGGNTYGELGTDEGYRQLAPVPIGLPNTVAEVAAGGGHNCARLEDGEVWCWGRNVLGELGIGTPEEVTQPTRVEGLPPAAGIAAGEDTTCALSEAGSVTCWGSNQGGLLGDGTTLDRSRPAVVEGLPEPVERLAGGWHHCAVASDRLYCWGTTSTPPATVEEALAAWTPQPVDGLGGGVVDICIGTRHQCALLEDGGVACWGGNFDGQAVPTFPSGRVESPTRVDGLEGVQRLACGDRFTCALLASGAVECWGDDRHGQLGGDAPGAADEGRRSASAPGGRDDDAEPEVPTGYLRISAAEPGEARVTAASEADEGDRVDGVSDLAAGGRRTPLDLELVPGRYDVHFTPVEGAPAPVRAVEVAAGRWSVVRFGQAAEPDTARVGPDLSDVVDVGAGRQHSCALTASGEVYCWGSNDHGQIGVGGDRYAPEPQHVDSLEPAIGLGVGREHSCAVEADGDVYCWGANAERQLGDGTDADRALPVAVVDLPPVVEVYAGLQHTCAVDPGDRHVVCWGNNRYGQLGDGANLYRERPVAVAGIDGVVDLALGWNFTCALREEGTVWCWGNPRVASAGRGGSTLVPTKVEPVGDDVVALAAGDQHVCTLSEAGEVACWGTASHGEIGVSAGPSEEPIAEPTVVSGFSTFSEGSRAVALTAGENATCAISSQGTARCAGFNSWGQLDGSPVELLRTPSDIHGLGGLGRLALGQAHTCALVEDGAVTCWGNNMNGQLGDGTLNSRLGPAPPEPLGDIAQLALGGSHSCALDETGRAWCWGVNFESQLGPGLRGGSVERAAPVALPERLTQVALGHAHTCAIDEAGRVGCWGHNASGQTGSATGSWGSEPHWIEGLPPAAQVAAGAAFTCALLEDKTVACWGANESGQLGDGTRTERVGAGPVAGLTEVEAIAAGGRHACARLADGRVACWGRGGDGQLGTGTTFDQLEPTVIPGLDQVVGLALGENHSCARRSDGTAVCWGLNLHDQVAGTGEPTHVVRPRPLADFDDVVDIAAGDRFTCVALASGRVFCAGDNDQGRLGDGTTRWRTPALGEVVEPTDLGEVVDVEAGGGHACARLSDGGVVCWGANDYGETGTGREGTSVPVPAPVLR